jgi:glycosyltransferase involved in cell wall biosynthesis
LKQSLQRQIHACGLEDRVKMMGPLLFERLGDWYRAANLFVLPSRSEGLPNVLLEAMACGTPFVATRVGGIPEIARGLDSRLVTPGDHAALANAIELNLSPTSSPTGFEPHSWRESAANVAEVLRGLIPSPAPKRMTVAA